ncbi:hypothetical protein CEXT_759741 [Caerostris extrusa]|uniref:Uncharacterized protein n=1 Tax=Caerostris extrusa TaxID=172846 RepID=A0AAV4N129_CAEEX|nr:hypothetical protein CEXT_759741 [Caerostris extrusa]
MLFDSVKQLHFLLNTVGAGEQQISRLTDVPCLQMSISMPVFCLISPNGRYCPTDGHCNPSFELESSAFGSFVMSLSYILCLHLILMSCYGIVT